MLTGHLLATAKKFERWLEAEYIEPWRAMKSELQSRSSEKIPELGALVGLPPKLHLKPNIKSRLVLAGRRPLLSKATLACSTLAALFKPRGDYWQARDVGRRKLSPA
jgi:hypothetical protein